MIPRVSVVVPVLNARADLPRLLTALAALEWPGEFECLVVDNGSTDGSRELAAEAKHVRLLDEPKLGSYAARNRGVREASGDWIAFTDADCAPEPDWLKRLLAHPIDDNVGAIAGEVLAMELATPVQRFIEARGFMKHSVTLNHKALPGFSTANVAIRHSILKTLEGFREDVLFFGDMDFAWRMQGAGVVRLGFRPEAVVLHRHRRTASGLWRQGVQHGRGVAFMKRTYPHRYRISAGEQVRRMGNMAAAAAGAAGGTDRWRIPGYLALWYGGMTWGYIRGPAWVG